MIVTECAITPSFSINVNVLYPEGILKNDFGILACTRQTVSKALFPKSTGTELKLELVPLTLSFELKFIINGGVIELS